MLQRLILSLLLPAFALAETSEIRGTFAPNTEPPVSLIVRSRAASIGADTAFEGETPCDIDRRSWRCVVPAGPRDLRFLAQGHAPHYRWNVSGRDLGELTLARGAAISGWIDIPSRIKWTDVSVRLLRGKETARTVGIHERGFFQFTAVEPGTYAIETTAKNASTAKADDVTTTALQEFVLSKPLVLEPIARLELRVLPPVDPDGLPWHIEVSQQSSTQRGLYSSVTKGVLTADGGWLSGELDEGEYRFNILDARGARHHTEKLAVESGMPLIHVAISRIAVRGRVTTGNDPIEGTVVFQSGKSKIDMRSDSEGAFGGVLPAEGNYRVLVYPKDGIFNLRKETVEVQRQEGATTVELDLRFPSGSIRGIVVDETGKAVTANVYVMNETQTGISLDGGTDQEGRFEFRGLTAGPATLWVQTESGETLLPVVISDRRPDRMRVVVPRTTKTEVRVVTRGGRPISGALIHYFSPGLPGKREEVTGPDGYATLDTPSNVAVDIVIVRRGLPVVLRTAHAGQPAEFSIPESGGLVTIGRGWKNIKRDGGFVWTNALFPPGGLRDVATPHGLLIDLEPGRYTFCPEPVVTAQCQEAVVSDGGQTMVAAR